MGRRMRLIPLFLNQGNIEREILKQTKEEKGIIYGARSINKQIGIFGRSTYDYDIFSSNPRKSAVKIEKKIERYTPEDDFYVKKGVNPGTWKVKHKGADGVKGNEDDIGIVDFTETPKPTPSFNIINGVRYRKLSLERQAKLKAIRDPKFAFRKKKDTEDLNRINFLRKL